MHKLFLNHIFNFVQVEGLTNTGDVSPSDNAGFMVTPGLILCRFPSSRRRKRSTSDPYIFRSMSIQLSNDGKDFSDPVIVTIYNSSSCINCTGTSTCTLKVSLI
eukprot:GHVR01064803.1.p1 GENE.GHVR01064803.1~~GHVR01064803.1.p1  ORF type:complete len:104 (-),score=5.95 GHVR01064803.1:48-359(-)